MASTLHESLDAELEATVLHPLTHTSRSWFIWTGALLLLVGFGLTAYLDQLRRGLAVTGMRDTVIWGLYISNFVFFSGVSMAGTFISAMLRLTGAEWRRPLTRIAELTTVSALMMCGLMPMVDLGRPDRMLNLLQYGRLMSPIVWDIIAITTYLAASALYLYLFLIPDAALLRDRLGAGTTRLSKLRHRLYCITALRWQGLPEQHRRLERGALVMMLIIVPIGITVHSVVSWIFGMTFRAGWSSTIFAPYFAVGALYSGVGMLIVLMFVFRRAYGLDAYFTEKHFRYLGYLLAAFGVLYLYFTFAEYLTMAYKLEIGDRSLLESLFVGNYAGLVWSGFLGGQILPILLVALASTAFRTRLIQILFVASILVNVGMWIKRFVIVVPSLSVPLMPDAWGIYSPTWVELAVTLATFGGFALAFTLFAKLFPIISLSEMAERARVEEEEPARAVAVPSPVPIAGPLGAPWPVGATASSAAVGGGGDA